MVDFITKENGSLALTATELDVMQAMLDQHDRGGFYTFYNAISDSDQISLQGRISTFSGPAGGVAFVAKEDVSRAA